MTGGVSKGRERHCRIGAQRVSMFPHDELTERILEACREVVEELGFGFLESVYQRALLVALHQKGIKARG